MQFSITRLAGIGQLDEGMSNATNGATGYRFEPHGTHFVKPVRITIPFDPSIKSSETALSNLYTYFHDVVLGRWERLERESIDKRAGTITSLSSHFTDMINATLRLPEGPQPIQYDVNSIKNLEAANPSECVPLPDGPEPGPFGAASFRIPLRLPPGRGAASPQLALRYSSERGESWLGKGFDIEVPAITIDTRFGLPAYNGADRYSMEGEELLQVDTDRDGSLLFRPRVEKSFARIRWYGASGAGRGDDYWQVTEKNGTIREYGHTDAQAWLGPDRADRGKTFVWYLSKVKDSFGNTTNYSYVNGLGFPVGPHNYTYLSDIRYAGYEKSGDQGAFRVNFELEGTDREDRRLDCRGAFPSKLARRLQRVNLYYKDALVRTYQFSYKYNEFGQSLLSGYTEADGAGSSPFYSYSFDYYALGTHDGGAGFDAFGPEEQWTIQGGGHEFSGLHSTATTSIGGDLYLGLEFFLPIPFIGKQTVAKFGVRGGIQFSSGGTKGTFMDANGDGLPDMVWSSGGTLLAYLNTGSGFDTTNPFTMSGLPGNMDQERQSSFSFGASAGLLGQGGAITWQESWSQGLTAFMDVNGDGFADFISSGSSGFGLNNGGVLIPTGWSGETPPLHGAKGSLSNDTYERTYYVEDPFRAWKAFRSGTIVVDQQASLLQPTSKSDVSLLTDPPSGQPVPAPIHLMPGNTNASNHGQQFSMNAGDRIYFHSNPGSPPGNSDEEASQRAKWNIGIRYTSIKLFERLKDGARFKPPVSNDNQYPFGDGRYEPIYVPEYSRSNNTTVYKLKPDWESLGESVLGSVYDAMIEHGYFVPRRAPENLFRMVLANAAADRKVIILSPVRTYKDADQQEQTIASVLAEQAILEGFSYEPETASFIWNNDVQLNSSATSDSLFMDYVKDALSFEQKKNMVWCQKVNSPDPAHVREFADHSVGYEETSLSQPLAAVIPANGAQGNLLPDKGLLLETTCNLDGTNAERLWLRKSSGGQWVDLARESARPENPGQTAIEPGQASAVMGSDSIAVTINDHGVSRSFLFTGKSLVQQLSGSLYEGPVSAAILSSQVFSTQGCSVIPAASWVALTGNSDPANSNFKLLTPCYALAEDGDYHLTDSSTYTTDALFAALHALREAWVQENSIFSSNPAGTLRLVLLAQVQMETFTAIFPSHQSQLAGCFTRIADSADGTVWYYQNTGLSAGDLSLVRSAMERYRRDAELFPYYTYDSAGDAWKLKADVPSNQPASDRVIQVMDACEIQTWTALQKSIRYASEQSLAVVARVDLPEGAVEEDIGPTGNGGSAVGEDVSVVLVPVFQAGTGNTIVSPHYLHNFDSLSDYSSQNLVVFPTDADGNVLFPGDDTLAGGVHGWYYGLWSGYFEWDRAKIGKESTTEKGDSKPPYSVTMSPNKKSDGTVQITTCGRQNTLPVSPDAWVGNVSSYSDVTTGPGLSNTTTEYRFAAFIIGDDFAIARNGGDSYYRMPRGATGGGGSLPFIRGSHASAIDQCGNLGLGGLGVSGSKNSSSSWQYQAIMDLNGDRYPELVSFPDSGDGASSFAVVEGTGQGFGRTVDYTLRGGGRLAKYDTVSYGFGASFGSSSGGLFALSDPKGKTESVSVIKPEPSGSASVSGSYGSTVQSEGFFDMNGDGLPDHVSRCGAGNYLVALNRGDGTFVDPVDWGSGLSIATFPDLLDLKNCTDGVSTTGAGSFGASAGFSASIVGVSAGYNGTTNQTFSTLADVNGDDLPDQVVKVKSEPFFHVRYNLGDHFSEEVRLYRPEWNFSSSGLRDNINQDLNKLKDGLRGVDIPGGSPGQPGGLPSSSDNKLGAAFDPFSLDDDLEYSTGASFTISGNISIDISFWLLALNITPGLNGSVATTSASLKFTDVDGDGLPDHAMKLPNETFLRVKRNLSGKVGLLRTINLPQGGTFAFEYTRVGNTVRMPQSKWVLSTFTRDDGISTMSAAPIDRGVRMYVETYGYSGGYYDRWERLFFGFAEVTATRANGAVAVTRYLNNDYYTRGMSSGSELKGPDARGDVVIYQKTTTDVQKRLETKVRKSTTLVVEIYFPAVAADASRQYEPGTSRYVETTRDFSYDQFGNVIDMYDNGSLSESAQRVHARIAYDYSITGADYQKQSPTSIRVEDSIGNLMRLRQGVYGSSGELLRMDQYESPVDFHSYTIAYDQYGNLASISDPKGYTAAWTYDDQVHAYETLIRIFNNRAGSSESDSNVEWDYTLGRKTAEVDQNDQRMSYTFDTFGRLVEIRSPYDTGDTPAVRYQYNTASFPWTAVTFNKLLYDPSDAQTIQTAIAIDGLGRASQTAKQGERRDDNGLRSIGWNLSGAIAYDANGRVVQEGQPQFALGSELPALGTMKNPTTKAYDAQDRVIQQVLPDDSIMTSTFLVSSDGTRLVERATDPLGNSEERESDGRGNIAKVVRLNKDGAQLMSATYQYDGLSQILAAVDSRGNAVRVGYDLLGRRTSLQSPDAGIITMRYDESGNLAQKITSALRSKGAAIDYQYDGLNRLLAITYSDSVGVNYSYGEPRAANNGAGRLLRRQDETGTVSYQYGKLGEVTQMIRSINRLAPLEPAVSATFAYSWDYLGRLQQITYPDEEVVSYGYDPGGQVQKVTGMHWGQRTEYVRDIGYDEFGQRSYIEYGNGTRTRYAYDPARRWLTSISTQSQWGVSLQNMSYRFDLVGNILGYQNDSATYSTAQSYGYDELYQLVRAQGTSSYHPYGLNEYTSSYRQSFGFDEIGNMSQKDSSCTTSPSQSVGTELNYSMSYSYYAGKAHQAEMIGKLYYRYDANGNMIEEREGGHGSGVVLGGTVSRQGTLRMTDRGFGLVLSDEGGSGGSPYARYCVWDEENRLKRTVDGNLTVDYRYGADGQRAVKYSSRGESLYFDSMWQAQTDYPSLRQSKHIYVGSARVATQLNIQGHRDVGYENVNTFYYHTDHLGSSQVVSDYEGKEYERNEYTPYGELWVEKESDTRGLLAFKFTGKELDSETGLYSYGARYLNPRTSRWVSPDPAMGDYLPVAPVNDDARKHNGNLPGMGGVFNLVNLGVYHYGGNNPLKLIDPTGRDDVSSVSESSRQRQEARLDVEFAEKLREQVGTPYVLGGTDQTGLDCSGTVLEALHEMGYDVPDITAAEMASGKVDWVTMFSEANQERQGEIGVLSFFSWGGKKVEHVNVGVGRLGNEPANQVVDATEGNWMVERNSSDNQVYLAFEKSVNQTYAPCPTTYKPVFQGRINWSVIEKYRR